MTYKMNNNLLFHSKYVILKFFKLLTLICHDQWFLGQITFQDISKWEYFPLSDFFFFFYYSIKKNICVSGVGYKFSVLLFMFPLRESISKFAFEQKRRIVVDQQPM